MRNLLLVTIVALLPVSAAMAQSASPPKAKKQPASAERLLPTRLPAAANSCAAYGPGFVKLAGSDSCVKIGGGIGIDAGGSR